MVTAPRLPSCCCTAAAAAGGGLDERWGKRLAAWGYVTLTVDRFGPRGITNACTGVPPIDAVRRLSRAEFPGCDSRRSIPSASPCSDFRKAAMLALLSVERGQIERTSSEQIPRGDRVLSALPRPEGQHDRADADPDRRARRLDAGRGVPQPRRGPRRLGNLAQKGKGVSDQADRLSRRLSRFRRAELEDARENARTSSRIQPGGAGSIDRRACAKFLDATIGGKEKQP